MTQTNIFAFFFCWFRPVCELALPGPCSFLSSLVSPGKLLLFFVMNVHNCTPLLGRSFSGHDFSPQGTGRGRCCCLGGVCGLQPGSGVGFGQLGSGAPSGHPSCRGIAPFFYSSLVQYHVGFLFVPLFCSFCYSRSNMIYSSSSGLARAVAALLRGWVLFYRSAVPSSQRPGVG